MSESRSLDFFEYRDSLPELGSPGISKVWMTTDGHATSSETPLEDTLSEMYCYRSEGGKLLGFVMYFVRFPWRGDITMITHPDHRGRGICRSLLHILIQEHWLRPEKQEYSDEGRAVMLSVLEEGVTNEEILSTSPWASEYRETLANLRNENS